MGILKSKIVWALLLLLATGVVLGLTGRKSVHSEILIDAPPEAVWAILMDTDAYGEWNPVMELLEGEIKAGNDVKYRFTQDAEHVSEISSHVKQVERNQLLNQGGGIPFVLTFDHRYVLEPAGTGTQLTIHEDYAGIGVHFWDPAPVQIAYEQLNQAIKERVESVN